MAHAVVTGANRGIGLEIAHGLRTRGYTLTLLCRDVSSAPPAARVLACDLSDLSATRLAANTLAAGPPIDVFVHNAGLWPTRCERNAEGFERAFVVNHLAPFVLNRLLERSFEQQATRVVQVSAGLYPLGRINLALTPSGRDFGKLRTYATTKLCNLLCTRRWASRWASRGAATIDAIHPGVVRTGLGAGAGGALDTVLGLAKRFWLTPEQGAAPIIHLATGAVGRPWLCGRYWDRFDEARYAAIACDEALADAVWQQADDLTRA